jgi:hypothetical protein
VVLAGVVRVGEVGAGAVVEEEAPGLGELIDVGGWLIGVELLGACGRGVPEFAVVGGEEEAEEEFKLGTPPDPVERGKLPSLPGEELIGIG